MRISAIIIRYSVDRHIRVITIAIVIIGAGCCLNAIVATI